MRVKVAKFHNKKIDQPLRCSTSSIVDFYKQVIASHGKDART